jgi:hypothetical protein
VSKVGVEQMLSMRGEAVSITGSRLKYKLLGISFIGRLFMAVLYYCVCTIPSYLEELDESAESF